MAMRQSRPLRVAKWAAFVLGALLACYLLVLQGLARYEERRAERAIAEIRASGAPTEAPQLGEPRIPDRDNAALIYQQAFERLNLTKEDDEFLGEVATGKANLADPASRARAKSIVAANRATLRLLKQASQMP